MQSVIILISAFTLTFFTNDNELFDNKIPFNLISYSKAKSIESSSKGLIECSDWTLKEEQIYSIIKNSKQINNHEWHYLFDFLPCIYKGELSQNGTVYKYEINAGSWFKIHSKDTTLYYGSFEKKNRKLFLSHVLEEDE